MMIIIITLGVLLSLSFALNVWAIRKGAACKEQNNRLSMLKAVMELQNTILESVVKSQEKHIEKLEGQLSDTKKTSSGQTQG